jgi:hypothetical protein
MADKNRGFKEFVAALRNVAAKKHKPFLLARQSLEHLFVSPCFVCGLLNNRKTNRNVALTVYRHGYVKGNVQPTCRLCQKIRHGMSKTQLISLAALTLSKCSLIYVDVASRRASRAYLRSITHTLQPSVRAHSTNYNTYLCSARKRCSVSEGARCPSSIFTLTRGQFNTMRKQCCFYCGLDNSNGIDRVYPAIGYIPKNSVPCCKTCNYAKNDLHPRVYIRHLATIVMRNRVFFAGNDPLTIKT